MWTRLPRELALLIISLLDTPTLLKARIVCKGWRRLAADVRSVRCSLSTRVSYYLALFPRLETIPLEREFGGIFLLVNKDSFWQELHRRGIFLDVRPLVHPRLDTTTGFTLLPTLVRAMALEQKVMMSQSLLEELEFADGVAQNGLDACRRGHTLSVTVPYEGASSTSALKFEILSETLGRGWICDLCRLPGTGAANHCAQCGFDLCDRYEPLD